MEAYNMKKLVLLGITLIWLSSLTFAACPDGMVSYWTFDNDSVSGSTVQDVYGNNDGSINGATVGAEGFVGEAFGFDGSNNIVDTGLVSLTTPLTISAWVYPHDVTDGQFSIFTNYGESGSDFFFNLGDSDGDLSIGLDNGGHINTNNGMVNINNWYHFVGTTGVEGMQLYLNGQIVGSASDGMGDISNGQKYSIGNRFHDMARGFDGKIDEVAIFNRSLSASEVAQLYNQSSQGYDYCGIYKNTLPLSSKFTEFESTTNFSQVQNLSAVENLTLGSPHGTISFGNNTVNAEGQNYDKNVVFGDCFVAVNATALDYTFNATAYLLMNNSDGHCGDDTIFVTSQMVADAGAIKTGAKICTDCKTISVGGDSVTFRVPHFSSYAIGSNSNITIDANDPKLVNQTVTFTAIYRNSSSGDFISGANCEIELKGTTSAMNEGTDKYTYQTSFTENQTYSYNVTCSKAGYQQLKINDSFEILPTTEAVPEFSSIGILLLIFALISIYFFKTK